MLERLKLSLGGDHFSPWRFVAADAELLVTADTMVPGVHYFDDVSPGSVGHKLAAVNLSDIAAMGGTPQAAILQLSGYDPNAPKDALWLGEFSRGLFEQLDHYHVDLLGTSVNRGATTLTLQMLGSVPAGQALRRDTAAAGDRIFVTGTLGDAALALRLELREETGGLESLIATRLHRPLPRVRMGEALRNIASAAIDVSDGLAADLGHIAQRSRLGATLKANLIPRSVAFNTLVGAADPFALCLHGGDDYELLFTAAAQYRDQIRRLAQAENCLVSEIGQMTAANDGIWIEQPNGAMAQVPATGYGHFESAENDEW